MLAAIHDVRMSSLATAVGSGSCWGVTIPIPIFSLLSASVSVHYKRQLAGWYPSPSLVNMAGHRCRQARER